jgi:hypothetical protein
MNDQRDDREDQEQVNQQSGNVEKHESASPKNHQKYSQAEKWSESHGDSPLADRSFQRRKVVRTVQLTWR